MNQRLFAPKNFGRKSMRFLSLFSGIEAASVAWIPMGWECVAFAEVDPFACAVLKHHFPDIPNLGDVTKITRQQIESLGHIDLVVGGFPCQDVSVAGKRKGLKHADGTHTRSGLFFIAEDIALWSKARWLVVENVPGLFSSNEGSDFAAVVGELAGASVGVPREGWRNSGFALGEKGLVEWAVLDAQYFGVPQRRRRVFIVRDSGNWRSRPPILLEPESLSGHPAPSRETREGIARGTETSVDFGRTADRIRLNAEVSATLQSEGGGMGAKTGLYGFEVGPSGGKFTETAPTMDARAKDGPIRNQIGVGAFRMQAFGQYEEDQTGSAILSRDHKDHKDHKDLVVAFDIHTNDGGDVKRKDRPNGGFYVNEVDKSLTIGSPNKTNVVAFSTKDDGRDATEEQSPTLRSGGHDKSHANGGIMPAVAIQGSMIGRKDENGPQGDGVNQETMFTLNTTDRHAVAFNSDQSEKTRSMGEREEQAPTLREGGKVSVAFQQNTRDEVRKMGGDGQIAGAISAEAGMKQQNYVAQVQWASGGGKTENDTAQALRSGAETNYQFARLGTTIRRLTPRECERLQGFPDDFTLIPRRGKTAADGSRYKALGNSMAVPVMNWIGQRIQQVSEILEEKI